MQNMKKYNILFSSSTPFVAGAETNLLALMDSIDQEHFRSLCLFNPVSGLDAYYLKNKVQFIPKYLPEYASKNILPIIKICLRLFYIVWQYKINLIYINTPDDFKYFRLIAKFFHIPIIVHIHLDIDCVGLRWLKIDKADALLFPSRYLQNLILSRAPCLDAARCFFVHNAVDIETFYPHNVKNLRNSLGFDFNLPIVGCVGQLKEMKGQHFFLEAIRNLVKRGVKGRFIIVGKDTAKEGKYEEFLKSKILEYGIEEYVSFMGYRTDIPVIMSLCDLLVLPTLKESFGRVVIEAMACGTPVVASAVGGIVEIFKDGEGGLFCDANDANDLAIKIKYFFDNPDWWQKQKEKALFNVRGKFTQDKHTAAIERHILSLINGNADETSLDN